MNATPRNLGRYELRAPLGRGGAGEVWKAYDAQSQRAVAIKIFHADLWQSDPHFLTRFRKEGQILMSLQYEHLVQIRDINIDRPAQSNETAAYLVMDYVEGQTLADYIHATSHRGTFPPIQQIIYLFTCLGTAIDYLHQKGVVHGDIKPRNILLNKHNTARFEAGEPQISDAAQGRIIGEQITIADPFYISPEQARGLSASKRSDIYALGVILYEMCTGVQPFRAENPIAIMTQHINALPTPPILINPHIPSSLSEVILRALAKDPVTRFPTAASLAAAVADACSLQSTLYLPQSEEEEDEHRDQPILGVSQLLRGSRPHTPATRPHAIPADTWLGNENSHPLPAATFAARNQPPASASPLVSGQLLDGSQARIPTNPRMSTFSGPLRQATNSMGMPLLSSPTQSSNTTSSQHIDFPDPMQESPALPQPRATMGRRGSEVPLPVIITALLLLLLVIASVTGASLLYGKQQTAVINTTGQAFFQDDAQGMNDQLRLEIPNISAPPDGKTYVSWLHTDTNQIVPLGPLMLQNQNASLIYQGSGKHTNLLTHTRGILVTLEDSGKRPSKPSGQTVYQGSFDPQVLSHLKNILYATPQLPGHQSVIKGLLDTIRSMNDKAGSVVDTLHSDPTLAHRQAVRIIELIDGTAYARTTGDLPANVPALLNTQVGLLSSPKQPGYIDMLATQLNQLKQATGNRNAPLLQHLQNVENAISDLRSWLKTIHDNAVKIINAPDLNTPAANSTALQLQQTTADAYTGRTIPPGQGPQPGLGSAGAYQAYVEAQYMATLDLQKV